MLLLDSQVVLWLADDNPRLGRRARNSIENADTVYVSAATIWELTIKKMLGKLDLPDAFDVALAEQGITYLSVTAEHAAGIEEFPELLRHDPFDRLLVAQASRERCDLLTADQFLLSTSYPFVVDATR
jgi:PIN domain nuclease of toxin-antitoxin system